MTNSTNGISQPNPPAARPAGAALTALAFKRKRRSQTRRRGNVVVLTGLLVIALFGMVAFAIDIGSIVQGRTELQRLADACALAAVIHLPDVDQARLIAERTAMQNADRGAFHVSDVVFGHWDRKTATFTTPRVPPQDLNAVRVLVSRTAEGGNPLQLFFAPIFGVSAADVAATATAACDQNLCGPFVGIERLSVSGSVVTDSYDSTAGPYSPATARDQGSLCSDGPIEVVGRALVRGDAQAGKGSTITVSGSAVVTGSRSNRVKPLNMPPVDADDASVSNDNRNLPTIRQGKSRKSPLDANRNFKLDANQTYDLPPGTYYFNDMNLSGQSTLNVSGPTTIYLTGGLQRTGGSRVNSATQRPADLRILMTGGTAKISSQNAFYGVIYAPNTAVSISGGSQFYGAVVGKTLAVRGSAQAHYDESLDLTDVDLPRRIALVE